MYHRMLSVCFPNVFSIVSECFQNRPNTSRMLTSKGFLSERFPFRTLSVCFPIAFRTWRIDLKWTKLFPYAFRTLSESICHVLGPFAVFGKHMEPSTSKFSFWMHEELDACFPNIYRTCRMLLRILPEYTWMPQLEKLLELPNAVLYASIQSRTVSMLLEHTKCFPNIIRSLPKHPNSYSENKRNDIRSSVLGPLDDSVYETWYST
jgi:hypothetical protein